MLMLYFCNLVVPSDKGDYTRNEEMKKCESGLGHGGLEYS